MPPSIELTNKTQQRILDKTLEMRLQVLMMTHLNQSQVLPKQTKFWIIFGGFKMGETLLHFNLLAHEVFWLKIESSSTNALDLSSDN